MEKEREGAKATEKQTEKQTTKQPTRNLQVGIILHVKARIKEIRLTERGEKLYVVPMTKTGYVDLGMEIPFEDVVYCVVKDTTEE